MIYFNVGALHPATDEARSTRISAANDLVQRTLSQHGLMASQDGGQSKSPQAAPAMGDLLTSLQTRFANVSRQNVTIAEGAEFRQEQFTCEAGSRAYRTYVPATATQGVTGLVVMLHGCTQTAEDFALGTGMNPLAEAHGFVVVSAQQSRGDNAQSFWNWFSRRDQRRDQGEPAILAGITRKAMANYGVSRDRTFVAGLSAGAAMAVILGETYPDVFSAVGAHSGLPFGAAKDVASAFGAMAGNGVETAAFRPKPSDVRTIIFHGAADATVHPSNGEGIARQAMDRGSQQTIETEEQGSASGRSFRRKIAVGIDGLAEHEHWVVDGLGHAWSGGRAGGSHTDAQGPDASAEMVRFFFEGLEEMPLNSTP